MRWDEILKKLTTIVTEACKKIQKTFKINIPDDPKEMRNKSFEDLEREKKFFWLYSCGLTSLYLFHTLKDAGFSDVEFCLWTWEGKRSKKDFHARLEIESNNETYIIDNRTHMEIDIRKWKRTIVNTNDKRITKEGRLKEISKDQKLLSFAPESLIEKFKSFTKEKAKNFDPRPETLEQYKQWTIHRENEDDIIITPTL